MQKIGASFFRKKNLGMDQTVPDSYNEGKEPFLTHEGRILPGACAV